MKIGEGIQNEKESQKGFVPSSKESQEYSEQQTESSKTYQKELQDLELWRNDLLQKCEAYERAGKNCVAVRQAIEDEYFEKKYELLQRAYYLEYSA